MKFDPSNPMGSGTCVVEGHPPATFFPSDGTAGHTGQQHVAIAIAICRRCPVSRLCHETAEQNRERYGVWGGINRTKLGTHGRRSHAAQREAMQTLWADGHGMTGYATVTPINIRRNNPPVVKLAHDGPNGRRNAAAEAWA